MLEAGPIDPVTAFDGSPVQGLHLMRLKRIRIKGCIALKIGISERNLGQGVFPAYHRIVRRRTTGECNVEERMIIKVVSNTEKAPIVRINMGDMIYRTTAMVLRANGFARSMVTLL